MFERCKKPYLWLIRGIGVIVPRRLRADWRQEWEAELRCRETLLADWDNLNWRNKLDLLRRSAGAFWDALLLQPRRMEDEMFQDLRFGARMLLKQPGFSAIVILTLALGIGVNTAMFTIFNALALKPLPLKDADSIVAVRGIPQNQFSYPDYQDYSARTQTMAGLALMREVGATLGIERAKQDEAQSEKEEFGYLNCQLVSSNYFSLLGADMALGRGFLPEEERAPGASPVVVMSHYFWERLFKSDPQVIGQTVRLSGQPFVIVGVTVKEFVGTRPNRPAFWAPLMMSDALSEATQSQSPSWHTNRNAATFNLLGRMKPGVSEAQAQSELNALTAQLAREYPGANRKAAVQLKSAPSFASAEGDEGAGQIFLILPISVGLVLLIACANVANLMLARAAKRQKEIAARMALGATRQRIIRQLLTESVLVGAAGGALGLLLAWWALKVLYPVFLSQFPGLSTFLASLAIDLEPDYRVFGFTLLIALLAGLAAGLAPALQASRPSLTLALKGEGSIFGERLSQSRLRNALIVIQLAFSLVLLVTAGLLVRNLQKLQKIDLGFETTRLFTLDVNLARSRAQQTETLRQQIETRLRALPGVQSVSRAPRALLMQPAAMSAIALPGQTDRAHLLNVRYDFVSSSHLETLGVPMLSGRNFTEQEANGGARVAVLSEAAARKIWPQFNDLSKVLGQSIGIEAGEIRPVASQPTESAVGTASPASFPVYQVIGVARNTITHVVFIDKADPLIYLPLSPGNPYGEYLLVRTRTDASRVMGAVRAEIAAMNPDATLTMMNTAKMQDMQTMPFRIAAKVALALGLAALALASIGLYGVMSFVVAQRTREIGVRVALGAEPRDILALFLKQGMRLIGPGILLGLLGGAAVARLMTIVLVDQSSFDPLAFGGVSLCLTLVAMLATYLPARRATKVDPMIALRHDE
jgi:macrolide transport system ATP-binding/permease protein